MEDTLALLAASCQLVPDTMAARTINHPAGYSELKPTYIIDESVQSSLILFDCLLCGLGILDIDQDERDV